MKWTFGDVKNFAKTVSGGDDYNACDFRRGFVKSGTAFPDDWQDVFIRFATAGTEAQNEFLEKLKAGAYREKWGAGQWEQHRALATAQEIFRQDYCPASSRCVTV